MNFIWGKKKKNYSYDSCQFVLALWSPKEVIAAWRMNTQGLLQGVSWSQTALPSWPWWPSWLCAKTQYHMFLDFSPAPTGNHQQLKCFHKFRCLPELQVMRSGSHTNREEVLYRVHLISTQGEIRTENWKRKLKKIEEGVQREMYDTLRYTRLRYSLHLRTIFRFFQIRVCL